MSGIGEQVKCVCGKPRDEHGWMGWALNNPPSCNHYPNGIPQEPVYDQRIGKAQS